MLCLQDSTSFLQLKKIENRLKELSEECRNLKIQTTNLAALMNSVKELPIIVKSLETLINELQSSSTHSVSPPVNTDLPKHLSPLCLKSSCDAPTIEENDNAGNGVEEMVALAPGITILPSQRDLLTLQGSPKNYTYALMDMMWSRDVLATHSLTGKTSNAHKDKTPKPSLDASKVAALCDVVVKKFRLPDKKMVKGFIKAKLNNSERCKKFKKSDNVPDN
ncbi:BEN domain-containing protein 5-like [Xenia sp. Carnegie-2017]|uniref:BEN domain-containing protein 5-like n=1 Tax=Xenia sp. Carnegie-2017 TaxID=2897299 RepID=UPI001F03AAA9|nr:BEN domain-containing protein 5-like [Xenia sp. Carnegie-2017]